MLAEETTPKPESTEVTPGDSIREWFKDFMNLREGSDREGAVHSIISGKLMRGSNAWMLVCSIMIASLGLNLNSGAVIIGAMLISPLMNPILGVGLGVGTNDRDLLWQALKNFGIAIIIALVTSVIYFAITPIDIFTDEMQARTEPTILDALVAVFGGLAGIISVTRADKTNAIPGVAIATALMPPLCVAGYGITLAFSDPDLGFSVFWRAFYLFFLNSFFIAVTAYVIIRLLRFPYRKYVNKKESRKSQLIIGAISVLMILPGIYVLTDVLEDQSQEKAARQFTEKYFPSSSSTYLLNRENDDQPLLIYPVKDRLLDRDSIQYYTRILQEKPYELTGARIVTDTSFTASEMAGIQGKLSTMSNHDSRINNLEQRLGQLVLQQQRLTNQVIASRSDTAVTKNLTKKLQLTFTEVDDVHMARLPKLDSSSVSAIPLIALKRSWPGRRPTTSQLKSTRERLMEFLKVELQVDTVILVIEDQ